ncbi:MAG: hypothetical protein Q7R70_00510 [Candidatus Diapherotrites archaeon]|nr:hypothetical protein [Candidatus Diapherotrites archaeon]
MNSKGQLFSLDFIIAVALIMLAIGLLYKQAELFQYSQKDDSIQSELYRIGYNASNQLVGNPATTCELVDLAGPSAGHIDYLPNCLTVSPGNIPPGVRHGWYKNHRTNARVILKEDLGIPEGYDCKIDFSTNPPLGGGKRILIAPGNLGCNGDPLNVPNIFSIKRSVVFLDNSSPDGLSQISKSEFNSCVTIGTCPLKPATFSLQVWKT